MTQALAYPVQKVYNNYSDELLQAVADFEKKHQIDRTKLQTFRRLVQGVQRKFSSSVRETPQPVPMLANSWHLRTTESVLDPGLKKHIALAYFDGGYEPEKPIAPVKFEGAVESTVQVIPDHNPELYLRLLLSNECQQCPNPRHVAPAHGYQFELVQPSANAQAAYRKGLEVDTAKADIHRADEEKLKRVAPKLGLAVSGDEYDLRNRFIEKAEANPKLVISMLDADEEKLYALVDRAVKKRLVEVDTETSTWVMGEARTVLCAALSTRHANDQLVEWLMTPGAEEVKRTLASLAPGK